MNFKINDKFVYLDQIHIVVSFEECYKNLKPKDLEMFREFRFFLKACKSIDAVPSVCESTKEYWAHPKKDCISLEVYNSPLYQALKEIKEST